MILKQLEPSTRKRYIDAIHNDLLAYLLANNILEQFIVGMQQNSKDYLLNNVKVTTIVEGFTWAMCNRMCRDLDLPEVCWDEHYRKHYYGHK